MTDLAAAHNELRRLMFSITYRMLDVVQEALLRMHTSAPGEPARPRCVRDHRHERAVFVLREVFGYEYAEIASVVEKSEANCRQLFRRARQHLRDSQTRFDLSVEDRDRLAERFFAAVRDGDLAGLEAVLADDVVLFGDGGGKAPAVRRPVRGVIQVSRFVLGLARQADRLGWQQKPMHVNGHPGAQVGK